MDILDGDGSRISAVKAQGMFADRQELAFWDGKFPMKLWHRSLMAVGFLNLADVFFIRKELMRRRIDEESFPFDGTDFLEKKRILLEPAAFLANLDGLFIRRENHIHAIRKSHHWDAQIDTTRKARCIVEVDETILIWDADAVKKVASSTEGSKQHCYQC